MLIKASPDIKFSIIHDLVSRDNNLLNLTWLCEIAGVSRSGYYRWKEAMQDRVEREIKDRANFDLILWAYKFRGYDKGVRGINMRLLRHEPPVVMNPKKIRRLMRKFGLICPIRMVNPYRKMAKATKESNYAPNLVQRQFKQFGARKVLLTDITYLSRKENTKWTYLSVIMDAFTNQILAHSLSESLEVDFVLDCVSQIVTNHSAELTVETMLHSDQGTHYASYRFIEIVANAELRRSMSRRANCWDNAPQESLFGHMKDELRLSGSETHAELIVRVNHWVNYYNNDRPQWELAKLTPNEYYEYTKSKLYPLVLPHIDD